MIVDGVATLTLTDHRSDATGIADIDKRASGRLGGERDQQRRAV
jgi:hypothetical protein